MKRWSITLCLLSLMNILSAQSIALPSDVLKMLTYTKLQKKVFDLFFTNPLGVGKDSIDIYYSKYKHTTIRKFDAYTPTLDLYPDFAPYLHIVCDFPDTTKGCRYVGYRMTIDPKAEIKETDFKNILAWYDLIVAKVEEKAKRLDFDKPTRDVNVLFKDHYWHEMNYGNFENETFHFETFIELETKGYKWDYIEVSFYIRKK